MRNMIEPIIPPLPTFSVTGPVTFQVHAIEAPFIVHWLEWQAERITDGSDPGPSNWNRAAQLLQAAVDITQIWAVGPNISDRLVRKLGHAMSKRAGR